MCCSVLSAIMLPSCRFLPTCSTYAIESIKNRGPFFGGLRAAARIARCHPLSRRGVDPVK